MSLSAWWRRGAFWSVTSASEAETCDLGKIKLLVDVIVYAVLANPGFTVLIAEMIHKRVDNAAYECLVRDMQEFLTTTKTLTCSSSAYRSLWKGLRRGRMIPGRKGKAFVAVPAAGAHSASIVLKYQYKGEIIYSKYDIESDKSSKRGRSLEIRFHESHHLSKEMLAIMEPLKVY